MALRFFFNFLPSSTLKTDLNFKEKVFLNIKKDKGYFQYLQEYSKNF